MSSRRLSALGLLALAVGPTAAGAQSPLTYQQALELARERAPRVAIARARIDEARGRLAGAQVRLRDNPVLDGAVGPRWLETGPVTDYDLGLSQVLELGGRRAARIDGAEANVARETAITEASTRQVLKEVALAFVRGLQSQARLDAMRSVEALAREALDVAERRYRAGDIAVLDLNVARSALARGVARSRGAEAERTLALGELKVLLAWNEPADPVLTGDLRAVIDEGADVRATPASDRPEAVALAAEVAEARADIRLGRGLQQPELGLGFRVKRDEGHQAAAGGLSIVIPLFNRGQEQLATGTAREHRSELERTAVMQELDLRAQAAQAAFRLRLAALEPLSRDVIPALDENERLARRSFEVGELSLVDLIVIRRELVDTRLQFIDALAEAATASIEWQTAAGVLK